MRRQNLLVTPMGVVLTVLLFSGMGYSIWHSGGKAFSPGKLSSIQQAAITWQSFTSHADFEAQCSLCHAPLKTTQDRLCVKCHENIDQQMIAGEGTHGLIEVPSRCARCHPDHRGREFDPTASAYPLFDHAQTMFSLVRHQMNYQASLMECAACHAVESDFTAPNSKCEACHSGQDPDFIFHHAQDFSHNCLLCHDGVDRMTNFDHQRTDFPLDGQHVDLSCVECHKLDFSARQQGIDRSQPVDAVWTSYPSGTGQVAGDPFKNTPKECALCHEETQAHRGLIVGACNECHNTAGWVPATLDGSAFDHASNTGFSLARHGVDYLNQPLTCISCHMKELSDFDLQTCITCHASSEERAVFLQGHQDQFGDACLECHDGADRMSDFDHARFFLLEGSHANLECSICHMEKKFAGTPTECVQCHAEPAIHAGFFGLQCQYCHTALAWIPAQLRLHRFPLDHGGRGEIECQVCHPGNYAANTCYGCHDHQPDLIAISHTQAGFALDQLAHCTNCHQDGFIEVKE